MRDAIYLDTRPGAPGVFACPVNTEDYTAWLETAYKASNGAVPHGVSQRVNAVINAAAVGRADVVALGPHAGQLARFLEIISNHKVGVTVL